MSAPRLVIVVQSKITGDSRIQKAALSAARAGWEVAILGLDGIGGEPRTWLGPVRVIRRGIGTAHQEAQALRSIHVRPPLVPTGYSSLKAARRAGKRLSRQIRERRAAATSPQARVAAEVDIMLRRVAHKVRRWGAAKHTRIVRPSDRPVDWRAVEWREVTPAFLDWRDSFAPAIVQLQPDVVHSNDPAMIGVASHAVRDLRASGHAVGWLHDMHEHVSAVDWGDPWVSAGYVAHEAEFIGEPDALVTVSPEIADALQQEYDLAVTPTVVRNAPVAALDASDAPDVRSLVGLGDDARILVSSGSVDPRRGIVTAVEALPLLPDTHLVIVTREQPGWSAPLDALLSFAQELDVRQRVHLAPYVPTHQIAAYLSSADAGLFAGVHYPNYEKSLPTKFAEYLHAGLPLLISDLRVPAQFVRSEGVGEVFVAEDAQDLAAGMRRILDEPARYRDAIRPELLAELSWEHQAARLLELYTTLGDRHPNPPATSVPWEVAESYIGPEDPWPDLPRVHPLPDEEQRPVPLEAPDTAVKLLVGPANHAGQGYAWARAVERSLDGVGARAFAPRRSKGFGFPVDHSVWINRYLVDPVWSHDMQQQVLSGFTHVVREAEQPIWNGNGDAEREDWLLRRHGIGTAMMLHGSEIRDPARHAARNRWSPFADPTDPKTVQLQALVDRNAERVARFDGPVFVSTPDLLDDVSDARWCPVVVDRDRWHGTVRPARDIPVVLHAPSRSAMKGSDLVEPVLYDLDQRGVIRYRRLQKVPHEQMPAELAAADIVLDQFRLASYGVAACEAMASGCVVVGHVSPSVRSHVQATTGQVLPIVEADADSIEEVLLRLMSDRGSWQDWAARGTSFVDTVHDGRAAAAVLEEFLRSRL